MIGVYLGTEQNVVYLSQLKQHFVWDSRAGKSIINTAPAAEHVICPGRMEGS